MKQLAFLIVAPLALLPLPVGGEDTAFPDFEIAEDAVKRGEILSLATILDRVAAVQPGRVIEVELELEDGIRVYEVELISPDGRLLEVDLDARTGEVLSLDEDN
ncbi:peptidase YpeB-like protein [Cereibacter ovatus]|uniref:Peptidase YpeB-like protein n=1 Tax=Cereibacter ovatus TaxID=439529 RepID=A0A285CVG0_9RHOB|nr:PepSY domain-containing protein [Cereibacter ovatus]SNX71579.1 peptidase YpeB-like protein [Cereibacter ovatus]